MIKYLVVFILGGTLFTLLYHFCKQNDTIISSLIPAFPTLFLSGLLLTFYFNGNSLDYIHNSSINFFITFLFCLFLYITILYYSHPMFSLSIGVVLYLFIMKNLIQYKILK